jgi:hypothetical protein
MAADNLKKYKTKQNSKISILKFKYMRVKTTRVLTITKGLVIK